MSAFAGKHPHFFGPVAAGVLLLGFWVSMLASLRDKSLTCDEPTHAAGGYSYWLFNDYRLQPENGNLPQRLIALPLFLGGYNFPAPDSEAWRDADGWEVPHRCFFAIGNNAERMTQRGRAAAALLAVALGFLVWRWSKHLFGPVGGMLSLLLYVFDPSILANGALMTSDTASALFFLAATWAFWRLLQRITWTRVLIAGAATAGLSLSKMSAPLIVPIGLLLILAVVVDHRPMRFALFGQRDLRGLSAKVAAVGGATVVGAAITLVVIWGFYGFRYSAFAPSMPGEFADPTWESVLEKAPPNEILARLQLNDSEQKRVQEIFTEENGDLNSWTAASLSAFKTVKREVVTAQQAAQLDTMLSQPSQHLIPGVLERLRQSRVLPEAYIYGMGFTWWNSHAHAAFLNGRFSLSGWRLFFPYTFLVKTPIAMLAFVLLAIGAAFDKSRRSTTRGQTLWRRTYDCLPLWALLAVYWTAAISSHINIGHRHILPVYPPIFVLCGVASYWIDRAMESHPAIASKRRWPTAAALTVVLSIVILVADTCYRFPNYIAYFNGIVRPATAYRHLVDSSLDWGQDLPSLARYSAANCSRERCYLRYFGSASPEYYGIRAEPLETANAVRTLTIPTQSAEQLLTQFFQDESDYDPNTVVRANEDGRVVATVVKKPDLLRLQPGIYFISATMLQPVTKDAWNAFGPWSRQSEQQYQTDRALIAPLLFADVATRQAALAKYSPDMWRAAILNYDHDRFYRLTAFLRRREPDGNVNYSILIYRLTEKDLAQALDGPPPAVSSAFSLQSSKILRIEPVNVGIGR